MYISVTFFCLLYLSFYNSILYVSIITVCRLFHIPIICLFAIYLPCDVHTCSIICILLPPFTLTLPVTYYFHLWCLNSNLNPITSKSVNLCVKQYIPMANPINRFVDNMQLSIETSLTHLLHSENSDELNVIRHSPYISDDELFEQRVNCKNGLSILSLNCQSLHAKFDYIKLLIEKFMHNNCPLQVLCLQETWISSGTDLSPYIIPGYHLISTPHYASSHGGLLIYLSEK